MNVISQTLNSRPTVHNTQFAEQSERRPALPKRPYPAHKCFLPETETFDRRTHHRFKVPDGVLAVCNHYAGKVIDLSKSGIAIMIVHHNDKTDPSQQHKPFPSDSISILPSVGNGFLLSDIKVGKIHDQNIGLYQNNSSITLYRRSIEFAAPLTSEQFRLLAPLLVRGNA